MDFSTSNEDLERGPVVPAPAPQDLPRLPYIVEALATHTHSFIFLHGLGSNGRDFSFEFLEASPISAGLLLPQVFPAGTRFIFPNAAHRRASAMKRSLLNMWFDIVRLQDPEYRKETQVQGLVDSAAQLVPLIQAEVDKVGAANVILGGISNGSAMSMALLLALGPGMGLGGYIGFCSYMPFQRDVLEAVTERSDGVEDDPFAQDEDESVDKTLAVRAAEFTRDLLDMDTWTGVADARLSLTPTTPVFLGHGALDEKKPPAIGEAAAATLRAAGHDVTWKLYSELGHWYQVPEGIDDMVEFIRAKIGWGMNTSLGR